jgi:hypothetical protein
MKMRLARLPLGKCKVSFVCGIIKEVTTMLIFSEEGTDHLGDFGIDVRIMLKWISQK